MSDLASFFNQLEQSFKAGTFVKVTLSKPAYKSDGLLNVYIREVTIKGEQQFSFTYRNRTNDQVKNYPLKAAQLEMNKLLSGKFRIANLFTLNEDVTVQISKKGKIAYRTQAPSFKHKPSLDHDKEKEKRAIAGKWLQLLGICDVDGKVIPKMADKYRQINKYLEVIEGLLKNTKLPSKVKVVDMGSGKGYLTFALYDYLVNRTKLDVDITGIELRKELVDFCNQTAKDCGFDHLNFQQQSIQEFENKKVDILIALHACDTATDDAISKGLAANAKLIITAPCCHKQIRQQVKGKEQESPILKYGIFKDRQFEMVTDTLRALIMEQHQYQTNIFEFISNEHTRKNVMLVGVKSNKQPDIENIQSKVEAIKQTFGIDQHYLEAVI